MSILVTGATGFIGSHFCVEALAQGLDLVLVDNFENSSEKVLDKIELLTGVKPDFHQVDLRDTEKLESLFKDYSFESVVHFAGYKAVGESSADPLMYYRNNIVGSLNLLEMMKRYEVNNLVFSSSATVYSDPVFNPYTEEHRKLPINPYGNTKSMFEDIMQDYAAANPHFSAVPLRYFNPIGAHPSGEMGEDPKGIPNNLMPFITKVAVGQLKELQVFGDDYDTVDGTGVRDYIHVMDLAEGHIRAIAFAENNTGYTPINLGAGKGYSVLEVIKAFEQQNNTSVPYKVVARRAGDLAQYWADATRAKDLLDWETQLTIEDMVKDSWGWQKKYPNGFNDC
ncbi:UDP-glucose 4-epimerase GalE [Bacterioplanoides sp. SCSIO 12839]|uniref:UDP-glucose 4-epimerase GalE n=1 Tax=Bacterioplanoides sp. SCSIO 12839 TaxID=2829569 RepID=UPI00210642DA|nr:UDP-glucose 4-epimerase GalE [Bacterioplanoides sp. SCSIO 12839]UTW47831.1 UDP-glucose 4-epimerase GalE [Bacterioplanoides sp. SCSIO 12839]